eukprot:scaffold10163_cov270-Chaetoceros_neogracile.AAC.31
MLLSGTMNVVAFLFIREEWRFYVGALFFSSGRALRTQTSSTSTLCWEKLMDVRCFEGREEKKGGQICGCEM